MKDLLSARFSVNAKEGYSDFTQNQVEYINKVRGKILNGFTLKANNCPCGEGDREKDIVISEIDRYGLPLQTVLCVKCGTLRIDPYLDDKSLSDFYTDYYQQMYGRSVKVDEYFAKQSNYGKKFYELAKQSLRPGSNILEFGCGAGGALATFKANGHNVYGIEYSQELISYGKSMGLSNLYYGSLVDFRNANKGVKFDLIYSNHVFEHVNNPHEYLSNCREMLGENGSIICAIPDIYNSHTHIFPNSNFKPMFHIAHIYNYSMSCLENMAEKLGMEIQRLAPDPSIRTATSDMPELWFRMQANKLSHSRARSEKSDYLKYFKTVEQNFLNGTNLLAAKPTGGKIKTLIKKIIKWKK